MYSVTRELPCESASVPFRDSIRELLEHRALVATLLGRELRIRYRQAALGVAWVLGIDAQWVGKHTLFEGGTRLPLITRWPGHIQPGVSPELVCQVTPNANVTTASAISPSRIRRRRRFLSNWNWPAAWSIRRCSWWV